MAVEIDLSGPRLKAKWEALPSAPVCGRQEVSATVIDGAVYYVGGFSYAAPYSYSDVLRLARDGKGRWEWTVLPPLPWVVSSTGVASLGSKIYVLGGGDYDSKAFYSFTNRSGGNVGLGKRLLMLDTNDLAKVIMIQLANRRSHFRRNLPLYFIGLYMGSLRGKVRHEV
jgi:hypothetical protein